jgi:RinA family phage transcriptional activator
MIREYPLYDQHIKQREDELMNRFQEMQDENVGGGRAQNKKDESVADMAITLAEDKELINLKRNEQAIRKTLLKCASNDKIPALLDNITYDIIEEMYIHEMSMYTLQGIAMKTSLSVSQVKKKRQAFFEAVAHERGISTR